MEKEEDTKMGLHAIDEARRCLNCKKPRCRTGCPINTPIPDMIQMFLAGEMGQAAEMVFANNPLKSSAKATVSKVLRESRFIFLL